MSADQPDINPTTAWQPLETAPRDGRRFLVWDGWHICLGSYSAGKWFATHGRIDDSRNLDVPTHWHPLPDAPRFHCISVASNQYQPGSEHREVCSGPGCEWCATLVNHDEQ